MFRTALRNVLAHKARLLMTVLAVMLGVAFVSGTLVFTDTLGNAFSKQSAKSFDDTAVVVESPTRDNGFESKDLGLSTATLKKISAVDGVTDATGRVSGFAGVADQKGKLIGSGWANRGGNHFPGGDGKDAAYDFVQGSGPRTGQIALDQDTAEKGEYKVGDTVRVATNGPVTEYRLSGVFTTEDGAVNAGGSLVLFDTATAQKLYLKPGHFSQITVTGAAGAAEDKILADVRKVLPKGADAETGQTLADDQAEMIKREMNGLNTMLLAFAGIALFVGIFLIANTFSMLVAQRTKELALLRAVGASRGQVRRSVILEAAVVGLLASAIGFVLGLGLATGLRSGMGSIGAQIPDGPLIISTTAVLAAFGVGVLITVLAAYLPARRAARIAPVAAMGSAHLPASNKSLLVRNIIGAVLTSIGLVLVFAGASAKGSEGRMLIGGGVFLALIGVIVLIPLLSRPVIGMVRPILDKGFGVAGKLARQNALRNPRRTGATASALAIGLTLVTGLTVIGVTLGTAIDKATTENVRANYMVMMANQSPLDRSALTALEKADGVTAVSPMQLLSAEIKNSDRDITAVTPGDIEKVATMKVASGSLDTLADGQIAIAEKTADKNGWKPGDTIPVTFTKGGDTVSKETKKLTVGAVFTENELVSSYLVSTDLVASYDPNPYIKEIWVAMDGGESSANEQALIDALGDNPSVNIMGKQDIRNMFGGIINTMLNIMYGLLGMALIIAVLGVINTMAMSVFERQREIGMLRAIGLDRGRVKRMIRLEAVVISLFGAVVGIVLGTYIAWAVGETFKASIPGYVLVLPWGRIAIFLLLAGVVGVLASLWPARSAARLNMLTAIKTE
ncbi:ABC transporter permease [Streptomyces yaizuensis]|uniref:FtsX-like permease family protein n=1 Tax=Streptomyces yaizuensis TaxID=2989713 RepID=A0ABQ5P9N6_9ACTN|nr:FtsX-like permease family protein [Streptomyces sp. YSPA8]GLF99310.1 FtsX-like permease family protein [Streptomyces sp. YSPA8]